MPAAIAPDLLENLDVLGVGIAGFEDPPRASAAGLWTIEILHQGEPDRAALTTAIGELAQELDLRPIDLEIAPVPETDWLGTVRTQFPAQRVARFWIHGSHVEEPAPAGSIPLRLDAGLAFGSGEHATTRGCLAALDALARRRRFRRVLDLGCGSGILAIAAAKCWPARVVAADNDPAAVEVARLNAYNNGVAGHLRVVLSEGLTNPLLRASGPYDLILANILADPLVELAPDFARVLRSGGSLVLSGLLSQQVGAVKAVYRAHGLTPAWLIEEGPWATVQFRRLRKRRRAPKQGAEPTAGPPASRWRRNHDARSPGLRPRRSSLRRR